MKVLRIFHGGGVPAYQRRDEELAALGHDVHLLVPKVFRELPTATVALRRNDSIKVTPIGLYGLRRNPFFFYNPFRIAASMLKFRADVIDIHEEPYSLAAMSILIGRSLARSRARVIFRSSQNEYKRYPFPFSAFQSYVFRVSAEAYVPSAQAAEVLRQKNFRRPITVVGNGVAVPKEPRVDSSPADILEVVCVGRLIERKGVQDLVAAVAKCQRHVNLTLVGTGPLESGLRARVAELPSLAGRITFTGAVSIDEAAAIMRRSDVICVPSHELEGWSEQFSRALVEGMANYCVPLVSDSGALPEISGGITEPFRWGNVEDLRLRLDELALSDELKELQNSAHERAVQQYSWEATSLRISEIYERVVQGS
ncbi:glycosyltransferase family 4 protein [Arthrobacter sp. NicSoilC5]|uniref:glycosyltransferase family 4 protein n=1 Tax=Arthrobacter sp. NicSoilC5 TaxID=2831000 RepID=UPI001CC7E2AD|nr:glycosyltransferase family 4 protein [Arthrobacter sp. NicSoilC5]